MSLVQKSLFWLKVNMNNYTSRRYFYINNVSFSIEDFLDAYNSSNLDHLRNFLKFHIHLGMSDKFL